MAAEEQKPRALVTPSVLVWARQEAGLDLELAAHKLGVKPDRLAQWEAGEELPTIRQLLELGRVYRRNPAVFYLPAPPAEAPPVHDFRRVAGAEARPLSPELRYEIRLAFTRRDILLDLMGTNFPPARLPRVPDMDADQDINGADAPSGRCFSALHELCHLVLRDGGLCLPGEEAGADHHEMICNRIAGAITLVPTAVLVATKSSWRTPVCRLGPTNSCGPLRGRTPLAAR